MRDDAARSVLCTNGSSRMLDLLEGRLALEAVGPARARQVAGGRPSAGPRGRRARSSHQSGASSLPNQRGCVTHTTTPPPGRTTRASSSAARAPSNQCQASLQTAPSTLASGSGSASARPASARSAPMERGEDRAHGVQRLDGDHVEALLEQRAREPPGPRADVEQPRAAAGGGGDRGDGVGLVARPAALVGGGDVVEAAGEVGHGTQRR